MIIRESETGRLDAIVSRISTTLAGVIGGADRGFGDVVAGGACLTFGVYMANQTRDSSNELKTDGLGYGLAVLGYLLGRVCWRYLIENE